MVLKKKWLMMLMAVTFVLLLTACGNDEESSVESEEGVADNSQDRNPNEPVPLSDGLEEYSVWIEVDDSEITRDSKIKKVFVFENGKVTVYETDKSFDMEDGPTSIKLTIEDIHDLSDDELIQLASDSANKYYSELEDVAGGIVLEPQEYYEQVYGKVNRELVNTNPITVEIGNERPLPSSNNYLLDIKIDDLGHDTESIILEMQDGSYDLNTHKWKLGRLLGDYIARFEEKKQDVDIELEMLIEYGEFEGYKQTSSGDEPPKPETFVPNPLVWEFKDIDITLKRDVINQPIFDTNFSGFRINEDKSFLTRVEDSFAGFTLDDPNTDKENVFIEGEGKPEDEQAEEDNDDNQKEQSDNGVDDNNEQQESENVSKLEEEYSEKVAFLDSQSQQDISSFYEEWDDLLNETWGELQNIMPNDEFETLKAEQIEWVENKEKATAEMSDETEATEYLITETRDRTFYLIENYIN